MVDRTNRKTMQMLTSLFFFVLVMVKLTSHDKNGIEYISNTSSSQHLQVHLRDKKDYQSFNACDSGDCLERDVTTEANLTLNGNNDNSIGGSYLLIQTSIGQLIKIGLSSRKEYHDIPFDVMYGCMEVIADKKYTITINHNPIRMINYTFGLGVNFADVGLSTADSRESSDHYLVSINRLPRPMKHMATPATTCYLEQDCSLKVYDSETSCGLVSSADSSWTPKRGYWKLNCGSCQVETTCDWNNATWISDKSSAPAKKLSNSHLRSCLAGKQLMFLGDSTNRGIMQSLMERVNGTLTSAKKSHTFLAYSGVGDNTSFSFTYYPAFWLKEWPTFVQALYNLPEQSHFGPKLVESTYLVVGGVQWLTISQLLEVSKFVQRTGIPASNVIVKTHSSGFLYPVTNLPYTHTEESLKKVINQNDALVKDAKERGFAVLDTLQMTLSRYKEFLQGKCACHFHEVSEYESGEELRSHADPSSLISKLYKLGLVEKRSGKPHLYHISGSIHDTYTDMLVSHLCSHQQT